MGQRVLVTGCSGFLGSHLCEALLAEGHEVVGVDCFTSYYPREVKERSSARLLRESAFTLRELDLSSDGLGGLLDGVSTVYHLAAQPGVRLSFSHFDEYLRHNLHATQRLLEAAVDRTLEAFVYASSSSVYGATETFPTPETAERRPVSPYGITKLAMEELANTYVRNSGIPAVGLRYFTAYGPRQRPDMAMTRFIVRALEGEPLPIFGDGLQLRDFTYVGDVVAGTMAAAARGRPGTAYNIGGGVTTNLLDVVRILEAILDRPIAVDHRPASRGDARNTHADGALAGEHLGFAPSTSVEEGLAAQVKWVQAELEAGPALVRAVHGEAQAAATPAGARAGARRNGGPPERMRVAMPIGLYDGLGGAQRQVQDLGPLLERRGVRTAVVTRLVTPRSPRYERQPGLHVYRVPVPPGHAAASVAYTALGAGVVARFRPDVIHAHQLLSPTTIGLLAGEAVRVPVVATVLSTGPGGDVSRLLGNGLGAQRLRAIVSRVSMFICIADEIEQELLEHGVPPERMRRIPNGVDLAWFRPPAEGERERLRAQLGIPADATVALYCGRLAPVKRLHVLLDAVRDSQVHVLLVGEGSEEPRLREQARSRELAGRVHFHPKVEDTAPLFRAADVYASASEAEGMSISVLEAMASALPVATAPASGMSELLGGVGGVLARDPSAAALAAALGALADDPARREAAGRAARARVSERWSLDNTADMLVALYEELRRSRRRVAGSGPKRAA